MPNPIVNRRFLMGGLSLSTMTQTWAAKVVSNGGAPVSGATLAAVDTWYKSLVGSGIDSLMISVVLMVPDNLTAAITPFFALSGNNPYTNSGFVSGDLSTSGLSGNGSKYLQTGFNPATYFPNPGTVYGTGGYSVLVTRQANGSQCTFGATDGIGAHIWQCYTNYQNTNRWSDCWNATSGRIDSSASGFSPTTAPAFYSMNRISSTDFRLFGAAHGNAFAQIGATDTTAVSSSPANTAAGLFCLNAGTQTSNISISFSAIHLGLTSTQAQALYNAVQTLRQSLGGGYIS